MSDFQSQKDDLNIDDETFALKIKCCGGCGFTTAVNAKPSDRIEDVKFKVWDTQNIPPEQQRFTYGELQLENDRTLSEYNIQKGVQIHMVVHLRGYNAE